MIIIAGTQHPIILPTLRWRPPRVRGTPICRESRPFAADNPLARAMTPGKPKFLSSTCHTRLHRQVAECERHTCRHQSSVPLPLFFGDGLSSRFMNWRTRALTMLFTARPISAKELVNNPAAHPGFSDLPPALARGSSVCSSFEPSVLCCLISYCDSRSIPLPYFEPMLEPSINACRSCLVIGPTRLRGGTTKPF